MVKKNDVLKQISELNVLLRDLPAEADLPKLSQSRVTQLRRDIKQAIGKLKSLADTLDPIRRPEFVFDPSDPHVIGRFIARTMLAQQKHALASIDRFYGSGAYAIYYRGPFPAYAPISGIDHPIYVGKADPAHPEAERVEEQGQVLSRRLGEHAKNIRRARNLALDDFECRYLVVRSAWQNTAEDYLINVLKPVWNHEVKICYGFGKHGDHAATRGNTRSPWDTLHPGRPWASTKGNKPNPKSAEDIVAEILDHFKKNPPGDLRR